jgi:hypothetical protein
MKHVFHRRRPRHAAKHSRSFADARKSRAPCPRGQNGMVYRHPAGTALMQADQGQAGLHGPQAHPTPGKPCQHLTPLPRLLEYVFRCRSLSSKQFRAVCFLCVGSCSPLRPHISRLPKVFWVTNNDQLQKPCWIPTSSSKQT